MDIATLIGVVAGFGVVFVAIFLGGGIETFVNVPSLLMVVGGTAAATLIKFPLPEVPKFLRRGFATAFTNPKSNPRYIYDKALEIAAVVRKSGLLGLESVTVENELFQRGLALCADGHPIDVIKETVTREVDLAIQESELSEKMFRGIGDSAPAFGMIGTLVGLVQMLSNLDDPASIGPAMAVAMLTTFYGALIGNLLALPIADKLQRRAQEDKQIKRLIIDSIIQIHGGQNPRVMAEILGVYLPGGQGSAPAAEAPAAAE